MGGVEMIVCDYVIDYVITAPGQGVQRPGMLDAWLEATSRARELVGAWSDIAGFDLTAASRDEAALGDTAVAQPLIVAASLLTLDALRERVLAPDHRLLFAGHSVGELPAAVGAGYMSPETAIALARARGAAMSAACALAKTGLTAVMPAKRQPATDAAIIAAIHAAGLTIANWNGCSQFVAAGPVELLEAFGETPPAGIRLAPLDVAGAFHTAAMADAVGPFTEAVQSAQISPPTAALLGNSDGKLVAGPQDLRERLVTQITSAVRWDLCAATIAELSHESTVHLELAPAGPLTRLAERAEPGVRALALHDPQDLERLRRLAPARR
jgi:[acyl-carrier-protein] S-malonyltransferase